MLYISEEFIENCVSTFSSNQTRILQEECAELIIALAHYDKGRIDSIQEVIEEMTHVLISLNVVAKQLSISQKDIDKEVMKKANKYGFINDTIERN